MKVYIEQDEALIYVLYKEQDLSHMVEYKMSCWRYTIFKFVGWCYWRMQGVLFSLTYVPRKKPTFEYTDKILKLDE